jgi:hypothetical protein
LASLAPVSFSLKRIPFQTIQEHALKNAGVKLPLVYSKHPWYYLSNFYYTSTSSGSGSGEATRILKQAIGALVNHQTPILLCCEPILGTNPRSLTPKTCEWTAEQRYESLCSYYKSKFSLENEIQIDCTLKTELTGHGQRWSQADRKFMWGAQMPGMYCQPISLQICSQTLLC